MECMNRKIAIGGLIIVLGLLSYLMLSSIAPTEATGQFLFLTAGIVLYILVQLPLPAFYQKILPYAGAFTFLLLIVTLLLGRISHGAMRWLPIGPLHLQISEFAKPILVLLLAQFAAYSRASLRARHGRRKSGPRRCGAENN